MKTIRAQFGSFIKLDFLVQTILLLFIILSAILDDYYTLDFIVGFGAMQAFSMLYTLILVPKAVTPERRFHFQVTVAILIFYGIIYLNSKLHFLDFLGNGLFIVFLIVVLLSIITSLYYYVITFATFNKPEKVMRRVKA